MEDWKIKLENMFFRYEGLERRAKYFNDIEMLSVFSDLVEIVEQVEKEAREDERKKIIEALGELKFYNNGSSFGAVVYKEDIEGLISELEKK